MILPYIFVPHSVLDESSSIVNLSCFLAIRKAFVRVSVSGKTYVMRVCIFC